MDDHLDREAVERVLRRAHRIEQRSADGDPRGIEPDVLVEAAGEVGIDPDAVRDSLAVERFVGPVVETRRFDGLVGPGRVVVERELHTTVDDALDGIEAWLTGRYRMTCDRRSPSLVRGRRRNGAVAQVSRSLAGARGEGRLDVVELVAEAVPQIVGSSPTDLRCVVRVSADRSAARAMRLGGGGAVGVGGVGVGAAAAAVAETLVVWPFAAAPLVVGGYVIARTGGGQADSVELEVQRLLSRVDRGERPVGLLDRVVRRARTAVAPPTGGRRRRR